MFNKKHVFLVAEKMILQLKDLKQWLKIFCLASSQLFRKKKTSAFFVYGALFLNLASWALLAWLVKTEQSVVILHYNAFMGIDVITNFDIQKDYFQIFIAPIGGTIIFFLNLMIAYILCIQSEVFESVHEKKGSMQAGVLNKTSHNLKICQDNINMLGVYLILGGNLVLQLVVFLYTIAIIWVNR